MIGLIRPAQRIVEMKAMRKFLVLGIPAIAICLLLYMKSQSKPYESSMSASEKPNGMKMFSDYLDRLPPSSENYSGTDNESDVSLLQQTENLLVPDSFNINDVNTSDNVVTYQYNNFREEQRHVAFLKVHKAASTTLQTIFFRFGYERNLSFVLPEDGHYVSSSTSEFFKLIPPLYGDHYDIICNHAVFNYTKFSTFMPKDTIYLGIVREPFRQFISAFHYYKEVYHVEYLTIIPDDPIENLILYPGRYDYNLSLTMNSMAHDFGFLHSHYNDDTDQKIHLYLEELGTVFDFVLIAEYLDESLILMKRLLNWSFRDILYISKNVRSSDDEVSEPLMAAFRKRNRLDYMLYEFFYGRFLKRYSEAGEDIQDEVQTFKEILVKVQTWCFNQHTERLNINETKWNKDFTVTSLDCKILSIHELPFIKLLKERVGN
ncbi:Galactose-3-O-sulfotransferase 3 [Mactra antiquata]